MTPSHPTRRQCADALARVFAELGAPCVILETPQGVAAAILLPDLPPPQAPQGFAGQLFDMGRAMGAVQLAQIGLDPASKA